MNSRRMAALAVGAGLVAGTASSLLINAWVGKRAATNARDEERGGAAAGDAERFHLMAAALAAKAAASAGQGGGPDRQAARAEPPPVVPPPLAPPEELPHLFGRLRSDHDHEPEILSWAIATKQHFSEDLERLAPAAHYTRFDLDCRSKTCAGFIEWSSCDEARKGVPLILHNSYSINAGIRTMLPSEPVAGACRVDVLFAPGEDVMRR